LAPQRRLGRARITKTAQKGLPARNPCLKRCADFHSNC